MSEKKTKNKHTYEYVKSFIENEGYVLLSTEYKNNKTKISLKCPQNHIIDMRFNDFKKGHRCNICFGTKKHKLEDIRLFIEDSKYKLLSNEYVNIHNKLIMKCPNGHTFEKSYNHFKNGQRCPVCSKEEQICRKKHTYEHVKETIENEKYSLVSTEYYTNKKKIKIMCDQGHLFNIRFDAFINGRRCPMCSIKKRSESKTLSYDYVKLFIENENYTLLSIEYIGAKCKLDLQCSNGHIFKMSFNNFKTGQRCPMCSFKDGKSKIEKEIVEYIKTIYNGIIIENDRTQILNRLTNKMLELDIFLPEIKKAIEFNGTYWHSSDYAKYKDVLKKENIIEM